MTAPTVPVRIRWNVGFAEALQAEATGHLPPDVAAIVEAARAEGYAAGRRDTLEQVTSEHFRIELLEPQWVNDTARTAQQRRAEHRAEAEAYADRARVARNIADGKHPLYRYRGGPVDWDTGLPAVSGCAWLRRRQATAGVVRLQPRGTQRAARKEAA